MSSPIKQNIHNANNKRATEIVNNIRDAVCPFNTTANKITVLSQTKKQAMERRALTPQEEANRIRLREIYTRKKKTLGLTQDKIADLGGWKSQGTVAQYFSGYIPLNTDAKIKMASILQVDVTEIDPDFRAPSKGVADADEFFEAYGSLIDELPEQEQFKVLSKMAEKIAVYKKDR
ncbi:hypothetical protein A3765_28630 [Oleiphilus sp. HI0130]|nr:hypothetical protein A3765_28915 [Oleiphilus sp. HI0130]KZZ72519.1 hypothetical protein A3765_28630 [Oleiphilus sp. HI0130]